MEIMINRPYVEYTNQRRKIDAYTFMQNPPFLFCFVFFVFFNNYIQIIIIVNFFTDVCWVIKIKIKELAKNETPEYYKEVKCENTTSESNNFTHTHTHTQKK